MNWPESVEVLEWIGFGNYFDGSCPCCTIGNAAKALTGSKGYVPETRDEIIAFRDAYRVVWQAWTGDRAGWGFTVETVSDSLRGDLRALLYNAAMSYLGYTKGQDPEANKLARKVKRNQ